METLVETRNGKKLSETAIQGILKELRYQHYSRYGIKPDKENHRIVPARKTYVLEDLYEDLRYVLQELSIK